LYFCLFIRVFSFQNVVRDDTDTIELAHQSDLATNSFTRGHIDVCRDANRLTESEVTQEKVCVSAELTWVCLI
jgi:hypothetical protein